MKINVQAVNFNAQDSLMSFTEKKLNKLDQFYDKIIGAHIFLKLDNGSGKNKVAEIRLEVPGDDLVVKKTGNSFEESIDSCAETLKKLIIRKKEKASAYS